MYEFNPDQVWGTGGRLVEPIHLIAEEIDGPGWGLTSYRSWCGKVCQGSMKLVGLDFRIDICTLCVAAISAVYPDWQPYEWRPTVNHMKP